MRLLSTLIILITATGILLMLWLTQIKDPDTYVKATLNLQGSLKNGEQLFKINCAGCHGIKAQGLLGPNLHKVGQRLSDSKIIHQIIEGKTPPMPSFKMEAQAMSDLLVYLHTIN